MFKRNNAKRIRILKYVISGACLALILLATKRDVIWIAPLIIYYIVRLIKIEQIDINRREKIASCVIQILLTIIAYHSLEGDCKSNIIITIAMIFISFPIISGIVHDLVVEKRTSMASADIKLDKSGWTVIILTSIAVITMQSLSSPIYEYNVWDDPNCYFTVGKGIVNGLVPYKDLVEQKGPFLHFIHAFSYLISSQDFFGVYLCEIVACIIFLVFSAKILLLFGKRTGYNVYIVIIASIVYSSRSFYLGDSAEEFALPFYAIAIYILLKATVNEKLPTCKENIIIGITSSLVLWIKFSLVGIYIGWIIYPLIYAIKNKNLKIFIDMLCQISFGVLIGTIPFFCYFAYNEALIDWIKVYFIDNIFQYSVKVNSGSALINVLERFSYSLYASYLHNGISFLFILVAIVIAFLKEKRCLAISFFLIVLSSFIFVFIGGQVYIYYPFVLSALFPAAFAILMDKVEFNNTNNVLVPLGCMVLCGGIFIIPISNKFSRVNEAPVMHLSPILKELQVDSILNYGYIDAGYYTLCDVIPTCRYFCTTNCDYPDQHLVQDMCVQQKEVDAVVTVDGYSHDFEGYTCIAQYGNHAIYLRDNISMDVEVPEYLLPE